MQDPIDDSDKLRGDKFEMMVIGDQNDPEGIIIQLPIKAWTALGDEGLEKLWGKLRRIEAISVSMFKQTIQNKNRRKMASGVIGPDGKPILVN